MASLPRNQAVTTSWVALPDIPAHGVSILNSTGAALFIATQADITAGGGTPAANTIRTLPDGMSEGYELTISAKELCIKAAAGAAGVQLNIYNV